jgi:hypothetical protein
MQSVIEGLCPIFESKQIEVDATHELVKMNTKKHRGFKPVARRRDSVRLSLADVQEITSHPEIQRADRRLSRAFQAITGWKMAAEAGIPKDKFPRVAEYEDALGQVKEAFIAATRDWLLNSACPLCDSRPQKVRFENGDAPQCTTRSRPATERRRWR